VSASLSESLWVLLALFVGLVLGKLLTWLILRGRIEAAGQSARSAGAVEVAALQERVAALEGTRAELGRSVESLRAELAAHR
jgi:hypothetical protein